MHEAAYRWVERCAAMLPRRASVVELGSRQINGSVRGLFAYCPYLGVDLTAGPGVDVVADVVGWRPADGRLFDTAVSTEALEHAPDGPGFCRTAFDVLAPGGVLILTAAGPTRRPHSGVDGGKLRPGEFYRNVGPADLREWLAPFVCVLVDVFTSRSDIYAFCVKGG